MNCRGLHCPGCHRSGPGGPITALLVLLAISAGVRVVALILPILLHILIVTALTAAAAAITAAMLAVRRHARPDRLAPQPLRRAPAHAIRVAASHWRGLPAPPGPRSLHAPIAVRRSATTRATPGQRKDTTAMKRSRQPDLSPPPGTRPPEYVIEAWVSPQLKDRIRRPTATRTDQRQPDPQREPSQPELEAEP
jgi:hypothetical protein